MDARQTLELIAAADAQPQRPALTPHLDFRIVGSGRVLLVSETFNTLLHGQVFADLIPLLDGRKSQHEVIGSLAQSHSESDVKTALASLASKGYLVAGDYEMDRQQAAFWSSLGAAPRQAEEKLKSSAVDIVGDDDNCLSKLLADSAVTVSADRSTLSVFICQDYLADQYDTINRHRIASAAPWILVRPKGMYPLFGPVFRPADGAACWECLTYRLRNNQDVHSFIRNFSGEQAAFRPNISEPAARQTVYGIVALEILKWLVLKERSPIHDHAISLNCTDISSTKHAVFRRPQCEACGDHALRSQTRPPVALKLASNPKILSNSGGYRTIKPQQTFDQYKHLISPISGIIPWVHRITPESDPWWHVHWAGSNLALRIKDLSSLRRSLRSNSAGKGSSDAQSKTGAVCEAIERYCGAFHGDEIRLRTSYTKMLQDTQSQAIHPNQVQLFSDHQLAQADAINARGHPYNIIPPGFDPDQEVDWTPVWSFSENRHRYLPTAMLYSMSSEQRGSTRLWADSNGCASGNTLEEAILQGLLELIERDAFAIWWYNRLRMPSVSLDSFDSDYLAAASEFYRRFNRKMWVLDLTGDFGIPVFVAISRRTDTESEDIIYGAGAHLDPCIAALRAVCELNQCLSWVPQPEQNRTRYMIDDPMCLSWWKNAKIADHPYLQPNDDASQRNRSDYRVPDTEDLKEDVQWCRMQFEAKGMELLVLDQTRPDIGMPVVRVIVPGLRHFWERFAPGRLYDVPVQMGWRKGPILETKLNPVPVIA